MSNLGGLTVIDLHARGQNSNHRAELNGLNDNERQLFNWFVALLIKI